MSQFKRLVAGLSACLVATFVASAEQPTFLVIDSNKAPESERVFIVPGAAKAPVYAAAEADTVRMIEDAFKRAAIAHEALYGTPFDDSVVPRMDWFAFKSIVPIYISDDFAQLDPKLPIMSVEGPIIYADGKYDVRSSIPLVRKSYFSALEKDKAGPRQWIAAQLHDLPVSHSVAAFHQAANCRNWPLRSSTYAANRAANWLTGRATSTMTFFSTVTRAKALQGLGEMNPNVGNGYRAAALTAHAIARAEALGMPEDEVEAEIEKWLGGTSLKFPSFRSAQSDDRVGNAFADPFLLSLLSGIGPQELYGLPAGAFNAFAQFDAKFACADEDAFEDDPMKYLDAFQDAFDAEAARVGNPNISLARALVYAQLHKIYLPHIAANQSLNSIESYDRTFLEREKWLKRIFKSPNGGDACVTIDFEDNRWHEISGEILPFGVHCIRITGAERDEVRNFTVSLTLLDANDTEADYDDLMVSASARGTPGLLSRSTAPSFAEGGKFLKTWIFDTAPRSEAALREPDGSKLLFLFNVAERLSETKTRRVRIDLVQGGATNSITARRRVQENGRNKPASEYQMPAIPGDLTTRVSFDLQSQEEYANPKLILTYTYGKGMEGLMNALSEATTAATAPITGVKYPMMLQGSKSEVDIIQDQAEAVSSLAEQLKKLQNDYLNNRFEETVTVVIEAPAPEPGFTGLIEDVLISVNWSDKNGKPHEVETIGPEDMSASPDNQTYLNNGTLNVRRFDRSVFIADYSGQLTHEPVLPPMRARQPHLNRDIAGTAKGTVVASGFDVATNETRDVIQDFGALTELGGIAEQIRNRTIPIEDADEKTPSQAEDGQSTASSGIGAGSASANCNCDCETYWQANVSPACTSICRAEYKLCRAEGPVTRGNRLTEHAEAIEFYWQALGISTPEMQQASREAILNMSDQEFQYLLDGVVTMGGPKSGGN